MTGQEKGDLLIQVTTWAGLTVSTRKQAKIFSLQIVCQDFAQGTKIIVVKYIIY
jgi:hypothetical protein